MSTSTSLNLWFDLSGVPELQNVTGKTITLRYYASGQTATGGWGFSSPNSSTNGLSISGYVELTTPVVTVSASSLTGFNYTYGTTSETEESFTVKGVRLTDNITITPSTNYEISQASGESFNAESSIVLLPTNGNVTETAIYVRLKNGLNVGNYNDEVINIVSDQAESELVICSGSVSCADPGLSFTTTPASKNFGDAPFIIEAASSLSSGTVSYESSNLAVATVNQSTGEVFIAAVGTTTLKATITANGNYCEDEAEFLLTVSAVKPTVVSTGEVPEYIKATVSGRISSTGGSGITESGAYWSTTSGFADGEGTKVSADNLEDSNFTVTITGLEQNTTYYYKLYAINSEGTAYSLQGSFATLRIITKPVVDIPVISAIGATQAALSATIGLDGGATITAQGFYYSTTNGFADGEGTQVTSGNVENKTFSAGLSNLTCGTTYYVRAYATNSAGTAYSVQQSFITATPSLIIDPVALNGFTYVSGSNTPSAEQSFNVSGTHLAGNITVTPSANYEISKNTGSNFAAANSIILSPVNEILASNTIYVRLKTGLNVGNYNETISIATTGVAAQTVTCNGSVSKNDTSDEMVFADDKLAVRSAGKQLFVQGLHSAATVTLYDVTGKVMASYAGVDNNFPVTVDLAGVFVVKVRNATQSITARMILK